MSEVDRKPKILIVDDTPENIQILMGTLKDQHTIVAAISGEKALKMAVAEPRPADHPIPRAAGSTTSASAARLPAAA